MAYIAIDRENQVIRAGGRMSIRGNEGKIVEMRASGRSVVIVKRWKSHYRSEVRTYWNPRMVERLFGAEGQ